MGSITNLLNSAQIHFSRLSIALFQIRNNFSLLKFAITLSFGDDSVVGKQKFITLVFSLQTLTGLTLIAYSPFFAYKLITYLPFPYFAASSLD